MAIILPIWAFFAANIPEYASSTTKQSSGFKLSFCEAIKNISGAGLPGKVPLS